mgnify:CR=1 FL=1
MPSPLDVLAGIEHALGVEGMVAAGVIFSAGFVVGALVALTWRN